MHGWMNWLMDDWIDWSNNWLINIRDYSALLIISNNSGTTTKFATILQHCDFKQSMHCLICRVFQCLGLNWLNKSIHFFCQRNWMYVSFFNTVKSALRTNVIDQLSSPNSSASWNKWSLSTPMYWLIDNTQSFSGWQPSGIRKGWNRKFSAGSSNLSCCRLSSSQQNVV